LQVNGWNRRTSSKVKLSRLRKPKAACFLSYMKYRLHKNTSNIMKKRSCYGDITHKRGRIKEGS
jgi:hypothetical protein